MTLPDATVEQPRTNMRMRAILVPESVDALHTAEQATGHSGVDVVNRALQLYAAIVTADDGEIVDVSERDGKPFVYLRVYR